MHKNNSQFQEGQNRRKNIVFGLGEGRLKSVSDDKNSTAENAIDSRIKRHGYKVLQKAPEAAAAFAKWTGACDFSAFIERNAKMLSKPHAEAVSAASVCLTQPDFTVKRFLLDFVNFISQGRTGLRFANSLLTDLCIFGHYFNDKIRKNALRGRRFSLIFQHFFNIFPVSL